MSNNYRKRAFAFVFMHAYFSIVYCRAAKQLLKFCTAAKDKAQPTNNQQNEQQKRKHKKKASLFLNYIHMQCIHMKRGGSARRIHNTN